MQESWYHKSSRCYRTVFRRLLRFATAISYEGQEFGPWLVRLAPRTPRHLLPNFMPPTMLRMRPRTALPAAPKLIYVGALSGAKGVEAALTHRVEKLLDDSALARRMGEAGRRHIKEAFGLERMTKAYAALYHNLLAPQSSPTLVEPARLS